ncbi:membrane lipoprotein [Streptomyces sp. NPDC053086]|uniref:membrane lipoprotein n=1 Tax=unclassified Streptomyces TaxID=2593676 RepID=UPI0037D452B9
MIRTVRALPLLLLLPALLTACGTEKADGGTGKTGAGAGKTADAGEVRESASAVPGRAGLDARLRALGIAPELVYVTDAPGFTLAQQSVGVNGDDGFSVAYWAKNGAVLHLYAERGSAAGCPEGYACLAPAKGQVVRISGEKVAPAVIRSAADAVHRPTPAELAGLLPPAPTATAPVARGDLPSYGDGAPDNSVGEGG